MLVLRALGLGDFLTGVPAYRGLRRAYPASRIVLAAPPALRALIPLTGAIDDVVAATGLDSLSWPGPPPDVAVNLHGRGPQSTNVLRALAAPQLLAWDVRPGLLWRRDEHEVARWCRLLQAYGIAADPGELDLAPPRVPSPAPGATVLHPGAAFPARRWPAERFGAVARELRARGAHVVLTGSPAETALAVSIAEMAGLPPEAVLAGRTGLAELAALVAGARVVVCGDTGMGHLATALGTPSVLLFGPTPPGWWGPPPQQPRHRVLWHGGGDPPGDPWGRQPDPALLRISVEEVLALVDPDREHAGHP